LQFREDVNDVIFVWIVAPVQVEWFFGNDGEFEVRISVRSEVA
jgi:hypothetical protein